MDVKSEGDGFVYCKQCGFWVDYRVYGVIACVDCEIDLQEEYEKA